MEFTKDIKSIKIFLLLIVVMSIILNLCSFTALVTDEKTEVAGKVFDIDDDSHYELQENKTSKNTNEKTDMALFG